MLSFKTHIHIILFFLFLSIAAKVKSQEYKQGNYGGNIGVVMSLGNRFDRLGITFNTFYYTGFFQVNTDLRLYYSFKNLGPKKKCVEAVAALGVVLGYGKTDTITNPFYSVIGNQTHFRNSFGYSYNCYFNKIKTTQQTGIISLQFQGFSFITENDIFARPQLDRFRTGAFLFQYQYKKMQVAVNSTLWTGQLEHRVKDANYPYPNGYMDTTNAVYPNSSAGLLSAQLKYMLPYYQVAQTNVGVDAEQVRNAIQNRFIHDMPFLPAKKFKSRNAHMPMMDATNNQYLYKENQKIRPAKLYYNAFLNPFIFY